MRPTATIAAATIFISISIFCSCSTQNKQLSSSSSPSATPSITQPTASPSSLTPTSTATSGEILGGGVSGVEPEALVKNDLEDIIKAFNDSDLGNPTKRKELSLKLAKYVQPTQQARKKSQMEKILLKASGDNAKRTNQFDFTGHWRKQAAQTRVFSGLFRKS